MCTWFNNTIESTDEEHHPIEQTIEPGDWWSATMRNTVKAYAPTLQDSTEDCCLLNIKPENNADIIRQLEEECEYFQQELMKSNRDYFKISLELEQTKNELARVYKVLELCLAERDDN